MNQVSADEQSDSTVGTDPETVSVQPVETEESATNVVDSPAVATVTEAEVSHSETSVSPVFEASDVTLNGQGVDITNQVLDKLQGDDFTVVVSYEQAKHTGIQALFGISNATAGNQNSYLDLFVRDTGELGMEARDTASKTNNLVARPASVWGKYRQEPVSNTVALVADSTTNTYSLYANGTKVVEKKVDRYLTLDDIKGVNSVVLGGVRRSGKIDFGFTGHLESLKIYNRALEAAAVEQMTRNHLTSRLIYKGTSKNPSFSSNLITQTLINQHLDFQKFSF